MDGERLEQEPEKYLKSMTNSTLKLLLSALFMREDAFALCDREISFFVFADGLPLRDGDLAFRHRDSYFALGVGDYSFPSDLHVLTGLCCPLAVCE